MFFKSITARALLGAGALSLVGGTAAVALPMANAAQTVTGSKAQAKPAHARDYARGAITKLSDTEMTIERRHRDKATKAVNTDDQSFVLNSDTAVYRWGDKDHKLGLDALHVGDRVRVRYQEKDGKKIATRILILPERRGGIVKSKGNDSFTIEGKDHKLVTVTFTDKTRWLTGTKKNRHPGSFSDLKVGDRAYVLGQADKNGNFDGGAVFYQVPPAK
jgi:hypothetical protein